MAESARYISTPKKPGISRIPPEILGEIFTHCLPSDSAPQNTQKVLSSVCRLWRTLVLTTPALWASLDITCSAVGLYPPLHVIHTHLQRSRAHPLSFILRASYHDSSCLLPVLAALAVARQRWENVQVKSFRMRQNILDLITQGDAPLLRSIRCDITGPPNTLSVPLRALCCCPRLESFHWKSPRSQLLLPLNETRLTSLSLRTTLSISECITILRLSPRLSRAKLHDLDSLGPSTTPHLTHPALCTLTIAGDQSSTLLAALTLPALLDLDFVPGYTLAPWDTILSAFLVRSKPILRQLSLSIPQMPPELALENILDHVPHLRSLMLAGCFGYPPLTAVIRALYPPPPPVLSLCPRLEVLELAGISDCPNGLCTAMLRARWGAGARANGVACLKSARIGFMGGVYDRDEADMKELCAEGLQGTICLWD
ncbi:hypothetical protein BD779DRAFT_1668440 [Infundibulicybe gibba]|nr:hypothetical protein BD779DRAFT_1668440 [Infundibulicybe gibba]